MADRQAQYRPPTKSRRIAVSWSSPLEYRTRSKAASLPFRREYRSPRKFPSEEEHASAENSHPTGSVLDGFERLAALQTHPSKIQILTIHDSPETMVSNQGAQVVRKVLDHVQADDGVKFLSPGEGIAFFSVRVAHAHVGPIHSQILQISKNTRD